MPPSLCVSPPRVAMLGRSLLLGVTLAMAQGAQINIMAGGSITLESEGSSGGASEASGDYSNLQATVNDLVQRMAAIEAKLAPSPPSAPPSPPMSPPPAGPGPAITCTDPGTNGWCQHISGTDFSAATVEEGAAQAKDKATNVVGFAWHGTTCYPMDQQDYDCAMTPSAAPSSTTVICRYN